MFSWKFIFSYPILILFIGLSSADDPTYWVSPSCTKREGFEDALKEVIWGSGKLADALKERDPRLDEPVQWFFNFPITQTPQIDYVENTYRRVSTLKKIDDQKTAIVRFMCDSGASFWPKNKKGQQVSEPDTDQKKMSHGYHDESNDMWEKGKNLFIRFKTELVLAYTSPHVFLTNKDLLKKNYQNSQPENRAVISVCDMSFDPPDENSEDAQNDKNPLWSLPTFREIAQLPLDRMQDVKDLSTHLALTIMHELVHVPILSKQEQINWELETQSKFVKTVGELGRDRHGALRTDGYYRDQLPGPKIDAWQFTVMNPDSYGYLLAIFRLQNKQWEPYLHKENEDDQFELITFRKKEDWEVVGDWEDAGDPPAPGSRPRPVYT